PATRSAGLAVILPRQPLERLLIGAVAQPPVDLPHAEPVVELAGRVPVEHVEIDAAPLALDRDPGEPRHQPAADPLAACAFADVQILQIQARPAEPGREARMEERRAGRLAVEK